ncbi:hypothetical protein D3C86_1703410 [compost metagenome]
MLQHVQQAVPGLGQGLVVFTARKVGEHAGHGDRGGGTTGAYVPEGDEIRLLHGEAVGLLLVAVEGVILAAGCLPHHQKHQSRLVALGDHPGICAYRLIRDRGSEENIPGVAIEAAHVVGGDYLLDDGVVVAPDRGIVLVIEGGNAHQKQQRQSDGTEPQTQPLVPGGWVLHLDPQQTKYRQHSGQQEPEHH